MEKVKISVLLRLGMLASVLSLLLLAGISLVALQSSATAAKQTTQRAAQQTRLLLAVESASVTFKSQVQEWKNILIRGNDAKAFAKHRAGFDKDAANVDEQLSAAQIIAREASLKDDADEIDQLIRAHGLLGEKYRAALSGFDASNEGTGKQVDIAVRGIDKPFTEAMTEFSKKVEKDSAEQMTEDMRSIDASASFSMRLAISAAVVSLLVCAGLSWLVIRGITRRIGGCVEDAVVALNHIAQCDLTHLLPAAPEGSLMESMRTIQRVLHDKVRGVKEAGVGIHEHAGVADSASGSLREALTDQTSTVSGVAASVEEISASMENLRESAKHASGLASETHDKATTGLAVLHDIVDNVRQVASSTQEAQEAISHLNDDSAKISSVVDSIKKIAEQTNLLALNAAIEAARAGEQGRGFAVVADEVRKLAETTAQATSEINAMIVSVQERTNTTVSMVRRVGELASESTQKAASAEQVLSGISRDVKQVDTSMSDVLSSVSEQSIAIHHIATSMESISAATEDCLVTAERVATIAHQLSAEEIELSKQMQQFKV